LIARILLFQATSGDAKSRVISVEETLEVKKLHTDLAEWWDCFEESMAAAGSPGDTATCLAT